MHTKLIINEKCKHCGACRQQAIINLKLLHSLVLSVKMNKNIFSNTIGVTSMCWITVNTEATLIINSMLQ